MLKFFLLLPLFITLSFPCLSEDNQDINATLIDAAYASDMHTAKQALEVGAKQYKGHSAYGSGKQTRL